MTPTTRLPAGTWQLDTSSGTVAIKGQSSPIDVTISEVQATGSSASFTADATIDRNAIGVDELPGLVIGRHLQLTVAAAATQLS